MSKKTSIVWSHSRFRVYCLTADTINSPMCGAPLWITSSLERLSRLGSSELPPEGPLASKSGFFRRDRSTSSSKELASARVRRAQAEKEFIPRSWGPLSEGLLFGDPWSWLCSFVLRRPGSGSGPGAPRIQALGYSECLQRASQMALVVKNPSANAGDIRGFNPWVGRSPGGGHGNPAQYSFFFPN